MGIVPARSSLPQLPTSIPTYSPDRGSRAICKSHIRSVALIPVASTGPWVIYLWLSTQLIT